MPEIKTRDVVKGTVRTLDKSAIAAERMKDAYIRTKEKAEHGVYSAESSPDEYAADRLSGGTETAVRETVHQLDKQGRRGVEATKDNISKAKEHFKRERTTDPLKKQAEKRAARQTGDTSHKAADTAHRTGDTVRHSTDTTRKAVKTAKQEQKAVKTLDRGRKTIKQTAKSTGKATAKTAKGTVKTAQKTVKTAERTAKTTIKTTQQAAKAANVQPRLRRGRQRPRHRLQRRQRKQP